MKKLRSFGAVWACIFAFGLSTSTNAAVTSYAQDFEGLDATNPLALDVEGFIYFADVWGKEGSSDAEVGVDIFLYAYGPGPAPNGGAGFSAIIFNEFGDETDPFMVIST